MSHDDEAQAIATTSIGEVPSSITDWLRNSILQEDSESAAVGSTSCSSCADTVPVAPAVVLPEGSSETCENDRCRYYPVATFVSNLVRSGIDSIAAYHDYTQQQQSQENHPSIRSEIVVAPEHETLRSVESEADIPTLNDEFVIIDGDLVALPPLPPNAEEQNEMEDQSRRAQRQERRAKRMKSRVKGVKKWIRKRASRAIEYHRQRSQEQEQDQELREQQLEHPSTTRQARQFRRKSKAKLTQRDDDTDEQEPDLEHSAPESTAASSITPHSSPSQNLTGVNLSAEYGFHEDRHASAVNTPTTAGVASSIPTLHPLVESILPILSPSAMNTLATAAGASSIPTLPPLVESILPISSPSPQNASLEGSVNADFIGNVEQVLESGMLTDVAAAVAFIEADPKDDYWCGEKKEQKQDDEFTLDTMLQMARHESLTSEEDEAIEGGAIEDEEISAKKPPKAKIDADSKPLSESSTLDSNVWNDTLKVVMIGSQLRDKFHLSRAVSGKNPKRFKNDAMLSVNVHTWTPDLKFSLWDIQDNHPTTQSLFYSNNSLYVILWDLAATNINTIKGRARTFTEEDDEEEGEINEFRQEELSRAADQALESDIQDNVLSWLDPIVCCGSAVLPVVTLSPEMESSEVGRRCKLLQFHLMNHPVFEGSGAARLILGNDDSILRVDLESGEGVPVLQEMIHDIGKEDVFPQISSPVNKSIVEINEIIRRLKRDHKVILVDHLMSEMESPSKVEEVQEALHFLSSIGEVLYYGNSTDEILSRYVILSRKWLVSALSCVLRPNLQREIRETRRFMNLQCVYSGEAFRESDVVETLLHGTNSNCPIISAIDSAMLWQARAFMRDAAGAKLNEASNTMYDFLERLLVHTGVFLPLTVSSETTYFVPSLLDTPISDTMWTYKCSESWKTTLCHSWLLRGGENAPPYNIMEHIMTCLLHDLNEFANHYNGTLVRSLHHAKSYPLTLSSMNSFIDAHCEEKIGRIRIHQVVCWKLCIMIQIGATFAEPGQSELRESFSEIFVSLVDEQSSHCVATRGMKSRTKRLLVCGKGQAGLHGKKLWKGGLGLVLDSIRETLGDDHSKGYSREVVCPECLAHFHPSVASIWSWDHVQTANETGNAGLRCSRGHLVDTYLLCGVCNVVPKPAPEPLIPARLHKPVSKLLSGVVLVGLWDSKSQEMISVGSGFLVERKLGLIVTAGHVLFDMEAGQNFGTPYFGRKDVKVVIGVIPNDSSTAVFRYYSELVTHDIRNVDACVLRITSRMKEDVDGISLCDQNEVPIDNMKDEKLDYLKTTKTFELEEGVRILGYNQGGEGVLEKGKHVNRCADFAKGYICRRFTNVDDDDSSISSFGSSISVKSESSVTASMSNSTCYIPREEIVVICPTISGHSGGPCINDEGKVVGILSRADPVDRQRCYLVPTTEIKPLITKAKTTIRCLLNK